MTAEEPTLRPEGSPPKLEGMRSSKAPRSTGDPDSISVSAVEIDSKDCGAAPALAEGFGGPIFEPIWWPDDTDAVTYFLDESPSRVTYRIGSIRRDGTPIVVIGRAGEQKERTLPPGNWSRPPELEAWRGLVRTTDAHIYAVLYREQQTIHLIGYASESEVVRAARSLRRATAE
jgi:hypothetical protein